MQTSLFELFRIGIGPSSSHTVGPMRAALDFARSLDDPAAVAGIDVELYGSLALTGRGHATDAAVLLGLSGQDPELVEPDSIQAILEAIRRSGKVILPGGHAAGFDLRFREDLTLPGHPNALRLAAQAAGGAVLESATYYSIGGGFITREGRDGAPGAAAVQVPHPFATGAELLERSRRTGLPVWALVQANESARLEEAEVRRRILRIWHVMEASMDRGLAAGGTLPGGLEVVRRAPALFARLRTQDAADPLAAIDWLNVFAMAVNEENAAGGRIVTAPTNGAAGIIPAVARYYLRFSEGASEEGILRYFLTAAAIGSLYRQNASISGAEVGCQGEVGVACSMAAAGLAGALGAASEQVEHAAEIGMEHHLGLTCDPVAGLVQIPCIERNAIGAVKAVNACRLAMNDASGRHKVSLDQVIRTMYQTGLDMQSRYKETSLAGLAVNVVNC